MVDAVSAAVALDRVAQVGWPVALASHAEPLAPIAVGQRRLIVAGNGLWVEARSRALHVRLPLAEAHTPYADLTPVLAAANGPLSPRLWDQLVEAALLAHPTEMARLLLADADGYRLIAPDQRSAGPGHVTYDESGLDPDAVLLDVHSHGRSPAYFSTTDDVSDLSRMGPSLSIVFGRCAQRESMEAAMRVVCPPYLINVPVESLWSL